MNYISPFNEPQWDWTDGSQEGTPANNKEVSAFIKVINVIYKTLEERSLNTPIDIPEAGQLQFLYSDNE